MKKNVLTLLSLVILLSMLVVPAHATTPTPVAGLWQYTPFLKVKNDAGECVPPSEGSGDPCERVANGNIFLETFEIGKWSAYPEGGFEGDSVENGKVVVHASGFASFNAIVSFVGVVKDASGAVVGSGTLEISVVGKAIGDADWQGRWVILSGTGELAALRGQGSWWGPGASGVGTWGDIDYKGKIHLEQ